MLTLCILTRRAAASKWSWALLLAAVSTALALQVRSRVGTLVSQATLEDLFRSTPDRLCRFTIAEMNLLCASNLCATNGPDIKQSLALIDAWGQHVKSETDRHGYRYARNPAEFESSPGFFRMLMMAVVLSEDYGVRYDPQRMAGPASTRMDDGFFSNPSSVFLQGLVGPERGRFSM